MSNLTIDECKRIISKGRKQLTAADDVIAELESENDELLEAWSNQAKTIYEQIMRIRELESLVRDILAGDPRCTARSCGDCEHDEDDGCGLKRRFDELGLEVDA